MHILCRNSVVTGSPANGINVKEVYSPCHFLHYFCIASNFKINSHSYATHLRVFFCRRASKLST